MEFRILGPLEIGTSAGAVVSIGGPRVKTLLAALLVNANQTLRVDWLADAVWNEQPPPAAAATLHSIVCRLRARLADIGPDGENRIVTDADGYRLRVEPGELDADVFHQRVDAARVAVGDGRPDEAATLYREALALWRGSPLANVTAHFAQAYSVPLDETRIAVTAERLDLELSAGRDVQAIPELLVLLQRYPLRENLVRLLMLALYRSGQQVEALHVFRTARRALVDELGVEPSRRLQLLHQQILNNDVPAEAPERPAVSGCHNLPPDTGDFTGRDAELRRLTRPGAAPGTPHAPLVGAINGMPGVGKTALAVRAAHLLAERYPDGQVFLDLRTHDVQDRRRGPAAALEALLLLLGVPTGAIPASVEQRAAMWRTQLAHRRMVVVLDDAADAAQVAPLLPGTPTCAVLVTSRGRLPGLPANCTVALAPLPSSDAATLFGRVVG
ncbi:AfsR/SARP family transcriptional regulator, partial [Cryptosporangium japonicum]|uniref:AfsR/SARP family transcriptional regulator n=1 Tax=Cryptosporangium japonicum TaxID=80872 RepID=UPI0031D6DBD7